MNITDNPTALNALAPGEAVTVRYRSTHSGVGQELDQTLNTEVDRVEVSLTDEWLFGYVYLREYRDDVEDDTIERRRLHVQANEVVAIEARRTTRQGAVWQTISRPASVEVLAL